MCLRTMYIATAHKLVTANRKMFFFPNKMFLSKAFYGNSPYYLNVIYYSTILQGML